MIFLMNTVTLNPIANLKWFILNRKKITVTICEDIWNLE